MEHGLKYVYLGNVPAIHQSIRAVPGVEDLSSDASIIRFWNIRSTKLDAGFGVDVGAVESAGLIAGGEVIGATIVAAKKDDGAFVQLEFL